MNIEKYEDLLETVKLGDYVQVLSRYADLIQETVNYIVGVDVVDEPSYMLESIGIQKEILDRAEAVFEALKKEEFAVEDAAQRLQRLCDALRKHEAFVQSMHSRSADDIIDDDKKNANKKN